MIGLLYNATRTIEINSKPSRKPKSVSVRDIDISVYVTELAILLCVQVGQPVEPLTVECVDTTANATLVV